MFGQQQATTGVAIKPMYQFDFGLWSNTPNNIDNPETDTRALMNRQTRWFIDHQQVFVFEQHRFLNATHKASRNIGFGVVSLLEPERWNSYQVTWA